MNQFIGTGVALITPFKKDKSVDLNALDKLVEFQIEQGINYLVVLGTTGEPATLNKEEKELVKKRIIKKNNGRLPLVLGLGGNNTLGLVDEIKSTDLSQFDAILSVAPYYNKPTQEGLYQHFKLVAGASPKPVIIYNVPGRTAVNILPETTIRLASDCANIIGIKEAAGSMDQALRLLHNKPKNFLIISGDDMMALPMCLAGGAGVISVIGQALPKDFSNMIQLALKGSAKKATDLHFKMMDSIDHIFAEGNPAGVKAMLKELKLCDHFVRLPLVEATTQLREKIHNFIVNY